MLSTYPHNHKEKSVDYSTCLKYTTSLCLDWLALEAWYQTPKWQSNGFNDLLFNKINATCSFKQRLLCVCNVEIEIWAMNIGNKPSTQQVQAPWEQSYFLIYALHKNRQYLNVKFAAKNENHYSRPILSTPCWRECSKLTPRLSTTTF